MADTAGPKAALGKVLATLANIVLALAIGSVFLLLQGENPLEVFYYLLAEPLLTQGGWLKVLGKAVPYVFTGLASALAFRCGLFNIGIEGQLFWGAFAAAIVGIYLPGLPAFIHLPLALLAAVAAGGLWALLAGWLKTRFNVNEVLSTIMMNYLATNLVSFLLVRFFRADGPQAKTPDVMEGARLAQFAPGSQLNAGLVLAVLAVVLLFVVLHYLPFGWRVDAVGQNPIASRYSGIDSKRMVLLVMLFSGMLAGLCGAERVLGAYGYMDLGFSVDYGFDGLSIAIIAGNHPLGVAVGAFFFGLLNYGAVNLNMMTNVPSEWTQSLVAIMLILVAAQRGLAYGLGKKKRKAGKGGKAEHA